MGAALVGGLPGAGANIRTIVNIDAGGKTRLSGVIHGMFLLAVLLGLSNLVQYIPNAVLAGILVGAGLGCIDFRGLSHIHKVPRSDAAVLLVVLGLTVFSGLIVAVAVGLVMASFIFMKNVADISERQTALLPLADEPWADEVDIPAEYRNRLLVKHIEGPLFFGFARGFLNIAALAAGSRLLVLRMDRVSLIDQSGAYALQDALVDLKSEGMRIVVVGLPLAQRDILEAICVIPELVSREDLFADFAELKAALPKVLAEIGATEQAVGSKNRKSS
jgi:SulP family sulfate permease